MVHPVDSAHYDDDEEAEEDIEEEEEEEEELEEDEEVVAAAVVLPPPDDDDEESVVTEDNEEDVAEVDASVEENDDDEEEEEVVMAAVIVDTNNNADEDDEDEVVSVAEPVEVVSTPPPAKKRKRAPAASTKKAAADAATKKKKPAAATSKKGGRKRTVSAKAKAASQSGSSSKAGAGSEYDSAGIPAPRIDAAGAARKMLQDTVPYLPANLGDSQVRAFGRLQATTGASSSAQNPFATSTALYSVGFSCDLYDFSPAHGRLLKIRCSILDGRRILQQRREFGLLNSARPTEEPTIHEGPVFRIMWGRGIDEDEMDEYKYDPFLHSDYVLVNGKGTATKRQTRAVPVEDMRVKTRFDQNEYYMGTIVNVKKKPSDGKQSDKVSLTIRYDDGTHEQAEFPDPDIQLFLPGTCLSQILVVSVRQFLTVCWFVDRHGPGH